MSAIAASGTQNSDLRLSNLTRSINAINNSNSRLSPKSGILSSSLVKLDFVNILYNKGFPADANHAELYFPTKNSNPHFTISAKSLPERILLDIISFLLKYNDNPNNVKSLETIMESIDKNTQLVI